MNENREAQIQERIERIDRQTEGRSIEGSLADALCTSPFPLPDGSGTVTGMDRLQERLKQDDPQTLADILRRSLDMLDMPHFDGTDEELVDVMTREASNYCNAVRRIKQRGAAPMS
jgi:hypothetical protein